jgi:hypothetical protein
MMTTQDISDFKRIYEEEFGESITDDKAKFLANNLIGFLQLVYEKPP